MRVRCGACRSSVNISRPGRFSCPRCGAVNQVKGPAAGPGGVPPTGPDPSHPGPEPGPGGYPGPASPGPSVSPPPPPDPPSPRVTCPECSFNFIVGQVQTAICPNCRAEVPLSGSGV